MIRFLRHISVRIWISAVIGIPASLVFLTHFGNLIPGKESYVTATFLLIIFFTAGYLMDQAGSRCIKKLIKEAKTWERSGIYKKSEKNYLKALRIYDSFLIPPWKSRKTAEKLTGAIAKFSLTCSIRGKAFDRAVTAFLSMVPGDADIALLWLERLYRYTKQPCVKDQEILTHLAEIHSGPPEIIQMMAEIFINLNRIDFAARKIYKKALTLPDLKSSTRTAIEKRLGTEEKALSAYALSDQGLSRDVKDLNRKISLTILYSRAKHTRVMVSEFFKKILERIIFLSKYLFAALIRFFSSVKDKKNVRISVKLGLSAIVCVFLIVFIVNTLSHLFPGKIPASGSKKHEIEAHIPELYTPSLYTIQVAAYLKKKYGDAYVTKLKSKGLDAYLSEAQGGGKTWFLVRVSGFPDRKKALSYGKKLKKQGYIDDFFVDNNSRRH